MKCVLLALGLALVCSANVIVKPHIKNDLDLKQVEDGFPGVGGPWETKMMATNRKVLPASDDAPLRVFISEVQPTPESNLEVTVTMRSSGGNKPGDKATIHLEAMTADHLSSTHLLYLTQDKMLVMDTDYKTYLVICMENTSVPQESMVCQLLGKTQKVNMETVQKFGEILQALPEYNQFFLDLTQKTGS
ncbi:glycodelin [Tenrec ecaudatus]|uniref:glycodelin n=1 Tax=Tenrec ecaudatus TaxID=94439 RepID=UPI003F5A9720